MSGAETAATPWTATVLTLFPEMFPGPLGASLVIILALLVLVAGGMYRIEGSVRPEVFGSIPDAMWWAVVNVTRLGAPDLAPLTPAGKLFAGLCGVLGVMATALPAGILASAFVTEFRKRDFVVTWKLVARVPFFRGLDAAHIAEIVDLLQPLTLPANRTVMRQGEPGDRVYFILSGQARVTLPDRTVPLTDGDFFGEMALLFDMPRSATVVTENECQLLYLDRAAFTTLLDHNPDLRAALLQEVRRRCQEDGLPLPDVLAEDGQDPGRRSQGGMG